MRVAALLLAAGRSERFGSNKLVADLGGKPVYAWSFETLLRHPQIECVGAVVHQESVLEWSSFLPGAAFVVGGGTTRQASALAGLEALPEGIDLVLVHDAARPFISAKLISDVIRAVQESGAACPFLPVTDTIKEISMDGVRTLDRSKLVAVQTPQGARVSELRQAYESNTDATDDLSLLEASGIRPTLVPGSKSNLKITHEEDLVTANALLRFSEVRTGFGFDIHRFSEDVGRRLMLGGVEFPGSQGLEGHSDADVLLHAIVDALLGAAALGDIGTLYPNDDPRWENMPSEIFLKETGVLLATANWDIMNIDATVLAEMPKVMPRRFEICGVIASILKIDPKRVSVKATTNERLGSIGRGEGISAYAVASIRQLR